MFFVNENFLIFGENVNLVLVKMLLPPLAGGPWWAFSGGSFRVRASYLGEGIKEPGRKHYLMLKPGRQKLEVSTKKKRKEKKRHTGDPEETG